jgi:alkylation response protein AidB-like acyl-CoA dehydrogenase
MRDAGRVALAADTLGAASHMLEKAVEYAGIRKQFGRAIGSFQAVKHMCAEMAAELEPARSLIWYSAYAQDEARADSVLATAHAKAYVSDAGRLVARKSVETHGGVGVTDDLGLHFWFKRIGWNHQLLGSPERLRSEAAALQDGVA